MKMRLIDADKLIADCNKYNSWDAQIVKAWVDDQPTVDIEPFKRGEWIPCARSGLPLSEQMCREGVKWYGYKCSVCNNIRKGNALKEAKYCEECGARMDEE